MLSFHATKFFNTFEGGAVVTNDDELAEKMRLMRNFGFAGFDNVIYVGTNGKMSEISAAMGLTNLPDLPRLVEDNRRRHEGYAKAFNDVPGIDVLAPAPRDQSNYQYVVAMVEAGADARDRALGMLQARGILARRYFWPGVHRMHPYATWGGHAELPATEWVADRVLVLPAGPGVTDDDVREIRDTLVAALNPLADATSTQER